MAENDLMNALGGVGEGESLPDPLPDDPFGIAETWFNDARDRAVQPNPNAMTLATADETGAPSARIVLCKHFDADSGSVIFYTNYQSRKGRELEANPRAALVMHWDALDRQIRITGPVTHAPAEQSDAYFASRAWEKRLGAWSSDQSQPIESREALLMQVAERAVELDIDLRKIVDGHADELVIPRPPHWGGYRVWAETVELWCSGVGRVHDRALWRRDLTRDGDDYNAGPWSSTRLQP